MDVEQSIHFFEISSSNLRRLCFDNVNVKKLLVYTTQWVLRWQTYNENKTLCLTEGKAST